MQLTGRSDYRRKAFTLIELIMVVVLIGVIAIFAMPNYSKAVNRSYEKAASNNLLIIYSVQKLRYNNGNNDYLPATGNTLDLGNINSQLGLSVIANGVTYECVNGSSGDNSSFACTATHTAFVLKVTEADPTVCCVGTCPTITTVCS